MQAKSSAGKIVWPNTSDELLIRACLLDGDEAIAAWRTWHAGTDYDNLDSAQQRFLPLLHENMSRLGVTDDVFERYRTAGKRFWAHNAVLYRCVTLVLKGLNDLNIPVLVLKGVPLSLTHYARPGLRPMSDADILVDPSKVHAAVEYFLRNGWTCVDGFIDNLDNLNELIEVRHGFNLSRPDSQQIDLHWNVFPSYFGDLRPLWHSAQSLSVNGFETSTLCATDHLLHACSQAAGWNVVRPIRWMADAQAIIRSARVDWDRLADNARHFDLVEPVRDALIVLRELIRVEIPAPTIARLGSMTAGFATRVDYRLSARKPIPIIGRPVQRYFRYLRTGRPRGLSFARYMKQLWGISSLRKLVKVGLKRVYASAKERR